VRPSGYEPNKIGGFLTMSRGGGQMVDRWWTGYANLTHWWKLGGQSERKTSGIKACSISHLIFTELNMLTFIHQSYPLGQLQVKVGFHSHH